MTMKSALIIFRKAVVLINCSIILLGVTTAKAQEFKNNLSQDTSVSIHAEEINTGYRFGDLPPTLHAEMIEAIQSRPMGVLDGGTYFVVGHYESQGTLGIGHLAASIGSTPPDWENSIWFIAQTTNSMQVALEGTSFFNELTKELPIAFNRQIGDQREGQSFAIANPFLFPWDKSQQWRYSYGWHGSTNLALDFAPVNVAANNMWILASSGGTVVLVCSDPYEAAINLTTTNGVTTYRHIDYNSFISQNINNNAVSQGQKLALLYNGNYGEGYYDTSKPYPWPLCTQGSSPSCAYMKYNTYCGSGTGAHVHWSLPAKPFTVEGWTIDSTGVWTQSGQLSRNVGALFSSTNSLPWMGSTMTIISDASNDGQILESTETSSKGGIMNNTATTLKIGDEATNKQYRTILSFDTSPLPDNALINSVTLKLKYAGKIGTIPFSTHGNLLVDVRVNAFNSNPALELNDFKAGATMNRVLSFSSIKVNNWYSNSFTAISFQHINTLGNTQFRLRFNTDDNNDFNSDLLKIYSGDAAPADRPQLIIEYTLP